MFGIWFFEDLFNTILIPLIAILLIVGIKYYAKSKNDNQ